MKTKISERERVILQKEKIINKRRKNDDSTNSDVPMSMKDERKDNVRYRLLKPGFKSNSKITDKRQSIVESICGELKVDEEIILPKKYSSSDESDEYQSRGNKTQSLNYNYNVIMQGINFNQRSTS